MYGGLIMTFNIKKFGKLDSSESNQTTNIFGFKDTSVTLAEIEAAGFFAELATNSMVREGDVLQVSANDGDRVYKIATVTSSDITLAIEDDLFEVSSGIIVPQSSTNSIGVATGESFFINGADINTGGTLTNVAYLDQSNTFTQVQKGVIPVANEDFAIKSYVDAAVNTVVQTAVVTLTTSEILNLRATPKILVAAQGANTFIRYLGATLRLVYGSSAYTESGDNLAVRFTDGSGVEVSETIETTGFIDQTVNTLTSSKPKLDAIVAQSASANAPLVLHNTGSAEFAAGDGSMVVYIDYQVISVA